MMTAQFYVELANHDRHGGIAAHCIQEEAGILHHNVMVDIKQDSETGERDTDWDESKRQTETP